MLTEGLSKVLWRGVSVWEAHRILKENSFILTPIGSNDMDAHLSRGKLFFLSFARSKWGYYGRTLYMKYFKKGPGYVVFRMDGQKLAWNWKGVAADYFKGMSRHGVIKPFDEMEDRIISDKGTMKGASRYINETHVVLNAPTLTVKSFNKMIADIFKLSEKRGIPTYLYTTEQDFKHGKPMEVLEVENFIKALDKGGNKPLTYPREDPLTGLQKKVLEDYLKIWEIGNRKFHSPEDSPQFRYNGAFNVNKASGLDMGTRWLESLLSTTSELRGTEYWEDISALLRLIKREVGGTRGRDYIKRFVLKTSERVNSKG